jgi:coenzyme F420-0:L-glutamate ligase/coenzyme F420-1:gamma-L-glutamate ligase
MCGSVLVAGLEAAKTFKHSSMKRIELIGLSGIGEVRPGDSVAKLICDTCSREGVALSNNDVVVIAHKIVSKAEGQVVRLDDVRPSHRAIELANQLGKEPALIEVILRESRAIVKIGPRAMIVETHHGYICANAGVDQSNIGERQVALLPKDPDASARQIRGEVQQQTGAGPGVIISDSFGRTWRVGTVDVAVGIAGIKPIKDERGLNDRYGYQLKAAVAAIVDEIAAAAELVMAKRDGVPVVIVRGCEIEHEDGSVKDLLRPKSEDLFRNFD